MPRLTDAELAMLHALAAPIDRSRQPEFMQAVTTKLEAAGPAAIGEGSLHRAAQYHRRLLVSAPRPSARACRASWFSGLSRR
jgi:hypothetical protein